MKKSFSCICFVLMLALLLSTVCFADEGNFDTLADWNLKVAVPEGATALLKGNCYYIYPQHEGYIPYVMITASRYDSGDKFISDFTASMTKQYPDLKVVSGAGEKIIGDRVCTEIDYTYAVSGYEVLDRRIILVHNGLTYMFASKEIESRGETLGDLLEQVVAGCEFLADGTDLEGLEERPELREAYLFRTEDGMPKYWLDLSGLMSDDLVLHCRFRSGEPEWVEAVFFLDLDTADIRARSVEIGKVTDRKGNDVSNWFKKLTVRFFDDHVDLVVKRDEKTLAGGGDDNILSGTYRMDPVGVGITYEYSDGDGMRKYRLDTDGEDLKLHAKFLSGEEEYYEEAFTLDVDTAEMYGEYALLFKDVYSDKGGDVSGRFAFLSLCRVQKALLLNVKREETTLAGGVGDTVLTGVYLLEPRTYLCPLENGPFSEEELAEWARIRYLEENGFYAPEAEAQKNADGTITVHLFEITETDGTEQTVPSAWYTVDKYGDGVNDITGEKVSLCR